MYLDRHYHFRHYYYRTLATGWRKSFDTTKCLHQRLLPVFLYREFQISPETLYTSKAVFMQVEEQVKKNARLKLNKQSVSRLTENELQRVKGGNIPADGGMTSFLLCTVNAGCCDPTATTVVITITITVV